MKRFLSYILSFLMFFTLMTALAVAQWSTNPNLNTGICTAAYGQYAPVSASDGAGGAIIAWLDYRNDNDYDIYAQRINVSGVTQWTANGIAVCDDASSTGAVTIITDGAGGAIIMWEDFRNGGDDLYAQRLNASGAAQWTANGVALGASATNPNYPTLVSDGANGAIVTWQSEGGGNDIYAQRIDASGAVLWTAGGVVICTADNGQYNPVMVSDGAGGAIISWEDYRIGGRNLYAQRVDASGAVLWTTDGVEICTAANDQGNTSILSDGAGGAFVTWNDYRSGEDANIFAQRINSSGVVHWLADGVNVSNQLSGYDPRIVSDGAGGAIIAWENGEGSDIIAQRVNSSGSILWSGSGISLCSASNSQDNISLISDGSGGAIATWADSRNNDESSDIYAQRVDSTGLVLWETDGIPISTALDYQETPTLVSDGAGGAIITWEDGRRDNNADIYAQWVNSGGANFQPAAGLIVSINDVPNDQGGSVRLNWNASPNDVASGSSVQVVSYGVWRKIPAGMAGGTSKKSQYFLMNDTLGVKYDLITTVTAVQASSYNLVAPTLMDSSASGAHYFTYLLTAHTSDPFKYFISAADSGCSKDNLAPAAALSLAAMVNGGSSVTLTWGKNTTDPDVASYEVHRSLTTGFIPDASTRIGQTSGTTLLDNAPVAGTTNYYRVITLDAHDNQSSPSQQATADIGISVTYNLNDKWNLVSIPLAMDNYSKNALFPTATSNAYSFENGYLSQSTLTNGVGYWLKFAGGSPVTMNGLLRSSETITLRKGWNMIGTLSANVPIENIISLTPDLTLSQFYGYNNGYTIAAVLEPCKGYWVKANKVGQIVLSSLVIGHSSLGKIEINSINELPPPPPEAATHDSPLPTDFSLSQNYPNPFNPLTIINYQLPIDNYVTLNIYNTLGKEVATLINGIQEAGYKTVQWDASGLPSGLYYYRITAGSYVESKKLLLMK